jgi:hypothetical protein
VKTKEDKIIIEIKDGIGITKEIKINFNSANTTISDTWKKDKEAGIG